MNPECKEPAIRLEILIDQISGYLRNPAGARPSQILDESAAWPRRWEICGCFRNATKTTERKHSRRSAPDRHGHLQTDNTQAKAGIGSSTEALLILWRRSASEPGRFRGE